MFGTQRGTKSIFGWTLGAIGLIAGCLPALTASSAVAGDALQHPERLIGVVRIEKVFEGYQYRIDREKEIDKELEPDLARIRQVEAQVKALEEEIIKLRGQVREDHPSVEQKMFDHRQFGLQMEKLVRAGEEKRRALLVNMLADVYKYFNAACRDVGESYKYGLIITTLDDQIPQQVLTDPKTNPYAVMSQIMMRSTQYVHPYWDISEFVKKLLNDKYTEYLRTRTSNRNAVIYPVRPVTVAAPAATGR